MGSGLPLTPVREVIVKSSTMSRFADAVFGRGYWRRLGALKTETVSGHPPAPRSRRKPEIQVPDEETEVELNNLPKNTDEHG